MESQKQKPISKALKLVLIKVQGLNVPEKRSKLLLLMKKLKADMVFIQETHFWSNNIPKLTNQYFSASYHATNSVAKTKGVSILISKNLPMNITEVLDNKEGRFIFAKGNIYYRPFTLANLYYPNSKQVTFLDSVVNHLTTFQSGILVLRGDFNIPLQPLLDTFTGTSSLPCEALKCINLLYLRVCSP